MEWRYERKCEWVFFLNTVYRPNVSKSLSKTNVNDAIKTRDKSRD